MIHQATTAKHYSLTYTESMRKGLLAVAMLTATALTAQDITVEDIWRKGTFRSEGVYGVRSMNDGEHYTSLNYGPEGVQVVQYSYETGEAVDTLVGDAQIDGASIQGYSFSSDEQKMMIATEMEGVYRYSTRDVNFIFDRATGEASLLSTEKQMFATFSPNGAQVAFVRSNNLFVKDLDSGEETQITFDGEWNKVLNGGTDWVYEEEFAFDKAFFWSPDGGKIAFYRFDESEVPMMDMDMFNNQLYPENYTFKYPKAGEANSKVEIKVYNLQSGSITDVDLGRSGDFYVPRIKWTASSDALCTMVMNRLQNELELRLVNPNDGSSRSLMTEKAESYIEISDDLTFLNDDSFLWTSEANGYNHIYHYKADGTLKKQITSGTWDVTNFYGYNAKSGYLFFQASMNEPYNTEVFRVKLNGKSLKQLNPAVGSNSAQFSSSFKYFILTHSDANTPASYALFASDGKEVRSLKDNADLKETLGGYGLGSKEFFSFETSEGVSLNGWMMKPADFDASKKYPVLMYVYGGPGSQTVTNSWGGSNHMWYHMLNQKGYIVVSIDNRGTGHRGRDFRTVTYQQLGKYEIADQIEGAQYLGGLDYVDADRIGIWGWSYGGYMASLGVSKGADVFKMGIAVAPVTNWRYYDTIYTERYMRTPQENAEGYDDNSPINHVEKIKGSYLLVHGSADDNVHYQNTMEMIRALVNANVQFDLFVYPDKNHGIYGGNTRNHLYTKMTSFILENL